MRKRRVVLALLASAFVTGALGQTPAIEALPVDLQVHARRVHATAEFPEPRSASAATPEGQALFRALLVLGDRPEAVDFLLGEILDERQSLAKRTHMLAEFRSQRLIGFVRNPKTLAALGLHVTDANSEFAAAVQKTLQVSLEWQEWDRLERQLAAARQGGDTAKLANLLDREERAVIRRTGVDLPRFMRTPPPLITVKPASQGRVRLLAMGDFGASSGIETQIKVAHAIQKIHRQQPFELGLTLGDNFYSSGLDDPQHPRWKTQWEDLYTPLGIRIYASLGNHDWNGAAPAAEVLYSERSPSWKMPAIYYTYVAGPIQFFVIETNTFMEGSQKQRDWLADEISRSTARWKVVYGHHPMYTQVEKDGKSVVIAQKDLVEKLLPVVANKIDVYLVGHHHSQQHHKPFNGIHQFISGTSGYKLYSVGPGLDPKVFFARTVMGFMALDVTEREFKATYYDDEARQIYSYTIVK